MAQVKGLLGNIFVLDLADEQGSFCSRLLADLGATVIKIESPDGDSERRIGPFYRSKSGAEEVSLPFAYHNANKLGIVLDLKTREGKRALHKLAEKTDVLIETLSYSRLIALGLSRERLRRINPGLIHISITGFGRSGRKRKCPFSDRIASASGGQMYISGFPAGPPVKPFGPQSFYTASLFGAVAVLLSLRKRKAGGRGNYVDLSIQEAVASTLDHVMVDYFHNKRIARRQGNIYEGKSFSILPCKDGYIQITILRNWETLIELMASENKAGDLLHPKWRGEAYRENHFDHILKVVEAWTISHTKCSLFRLGQAMRFPWAPVNSPREVVEDPQLKARRFFIRACLPGNDLKVPFPGSPYRFGTISSFPLKPAPLLGEHTPRVLRNLSIGGKKDQIGIYCSNRSSHSISNGKILKDIRVIDLTRMLSGPYATRILADFGAEVIKVQSENTAQGAERNDTPYFCAWNRNKRSISLDLNRADARDVLLRLAAVSDIVVENYSPRVMANWGLTYDRLREVKPDIIMASISAMGGNGPWRDFVGFAPTFHALSGLIAATSRSFNAPVNLGHAYGDVIIGLYAALAILAALEYRDRTSNGQHIDISGYEALCTLLGPAYMVGAVQRGQETKESRGDDCSTAAPDGCYKCLGDDCWCVISIMNEKEWQVFCRMAKQPELMADRFSSSAGRRKYHAELDRLIGQWTAGQKAEDLSNRLQRAGIAAAAVQNAENLAKDGQLTSRRFFTSLKHPMLGTTTSDRSALWPWQQTTKDWKAAPLFGEDNHHIFVELLGMSAEKCNP